MPTVITDDRRRITLPYAQPGERFDLSNDAQGRIILRKLEPTPAEIEDVPVVRSVRRGKLWVSPAPPRSNVDYAAVTRQERDER